MRIAIKEKPVTKILQLHLLIGVLHIANDDWKYQMSRLDRLSWRYSQNMNEDVEFLLVYL